MNLTDQQSALTSPLLNGGRPHMNHITAASRNPKSDSDQTVNALDILQDRSADTTVGWLEEHPPVEMVSRDRCGLYALGAARGAPQARQIADRFHLLQNLRHATEQQLIRAPRTPLPLAPSETVSLTEPPGLIHRYGSPEVTEHHRLVQEGRHARARTRFDRVRALHAKGMRLAEIMHETGLHSRTASPTAPAAQRALAPPTR